MAEIANPVAPSTSNSRVSKYRPEIDGLRAFAVVAVIINHFNKDLLPSGYLGVDIFFVISGYVITSSLADRKSKNFLDFLTGFYERRIKRLVPALVVFVLITSVLISLFNPDPGADLGLGWRSLFGISNISLYRASIDYFAQSTELNPFTHTWSLGVEEQFYLLFPFLIWFSGFGRQTKKGARNLFFWIGALTIASLIGFVYLYQVNQPAAYFLLPTRFWEMTAGCLIFIGFQKRARIEQALEKVPPLLVVAAMIGILILPVSAAVPATIGIVVLSAILVACLKKGTGAYKIFTLEKVVFTGLISYSLYLWHWSVLSISRWTIGIHWWSVPIQVGLMMLLAISSYKWIETPIRKKTTTIDRRSVIAYGIGIPLILSALLKGVLSPNHQYFYLGEKQVDAQRKKQTRSEIKKSPCSEPADKDAGPIICTINHSDYDNTVWIIGDSHAYELLAGTMEVLNGTKTRMVLYTAGGTSFPAIGHYRKNNKEKDLLKLNAYQKLENQLLKDARSYDAVIIPMRHPYHFGGTYYQYPASDFVFLDDDKNEVSQSDYFKLWKKAVIRIAKRLPKVNFVIMTPTPEWDKAELKECAEQKEWFGRLGGSDCRIERSFFVGGNGLYSHIVKGLEGIKRETNNVVIYDAFATLCPGKVCKFGHQGKALYKDGDHIGAYASRKIMKDLVKQYPRLVVPLKNP
jgi:peptidoglycan/LPS O-acetylase OafA/YrhL